MPPRRRKAPPPPDGCVWMPAAADMLGISYDTLRKWRGSGHGPKGFQPTGAYRVAYKKADLAAWLKRQYDAAGQSDAEPEPDPELKPAPAAHGRPRRTPATTSR